MNCPEASFPGARGRPSETALSFARHQPPDDAVELKPAGMGNGMGRPQRMGAEKGSMDINASRMECLG